MATEPSTGDSPLSCTRRGLLQSLAALGVGSAVFQRALAAQAEQATTVTEEMVKQAEWVSGVELTDDARKAALATVNRLVRNFEALRKVPLPNSVPLALAFIPDSGPTHSTRRGSVERSTA